MQEVQVGDPVSEHIAALQDKDWAIREEAATILGGLKDPRAVCPLVSILRDRDRSVREAAIGALTSIGEPSVTAVGACLADPELSVQEAASAVLASIADGRVRDPLIRALRSHDWIVRMHAAKALGRIQEPDSVPALIPLLQDKVKAVTGKASDFMTPYAYDAVKVMALAIKNAGSTDPNAIRDALTKIDYKDSVAVSEVKFDQGRDLGAADYDVMVIKNQTGVKVQ